MYLDLIISVHGDVQVHFTRQDFYIVRHTAAPTLKKNSASFRPSLADMILP